MMKFSKLGAAIVFLWFVFAVFSPQSEQERKTGEYIIHGASLLNEHLAVVNSKANSEGEEGITVFDLNSPSDSMEFVSRSELAFPLLTAENSVIFVAIYAEEGGGSRYKLIEAEIDGASKCKVLAESVVGIQEPFRLSDKFGDRTYFLIGAGRQAAQPHMPMRKIAYLEDGEIHVFKGPKVQEFSHIVQVGDGLIIGSAVSILDDDGRSVITAKGSNAYFPVEVEIGHDEVSIRPSDRFGAETPGFGLAKYYPLLGLTVVHSTDSKFRKISFVFDDGSYQGPVNMPSEFTFSESLDAKIGANGKVEVTFLATDSDGKTSIVVFGLEGLLTVKALDRNDAKIIRLDACGV